MRIEFRYGDSHRPSHAKRISEKSVLFDDELLLKVKQGYFNRNDEASPEVMKLHNYGLYLLNSHDENEVFVYPPESNAFRGIKGPTDYICNGFYPVDNSVSDIKSIQAWFELIDLIEEMSDKDILYSFLPYYDSEEITKQELLRSIKAPSSE